MATYYIDLDNGSDSNDGSTTSLAFLTINEFTNNSRSAGDIGIVRRGTTETASANIDFTSDGSMGNPIVLEADYDDAWGDETTPTATATFTFGSKTVTFSADVSSDISTGDWIYESTEDNRKYAYEVESVSTSTVTLYLPYKGAISGSSKTVKVMPSAPIWNDTVGNYNVYITSDYYWRFKGIWFKSSDSSGTIDLSSLWAEFDDCIFSDNSSNSATGNGFYGTAYLFNKCRFYNNKESIYGDENNIIAKNCLIDGNSISSSYGVVSSNGSGIFEECEFKNNTTDVQVKNTPGNYKFRNCFFGSSTKFSGNSYSDRRPPCEFQLAIEDYNNVVGDNRLMVSGGSASTPLMQSETTKTRSGGGSVSLKVNPHTGVGTDLTNRIELFEIPIQLSADEEKTVTVYFASDDNTDWANNPTADELYVEASYWGDATNKFRRVTRSTGTVDFSTDTDFDQTLTVTFTPKITGLAYIKVFYGKPLEAYSYNIFYCDPKIEIS